MNRLPAFGNRKSSLPLIFLLLIRLGAYAQGDVHPLQTPSPIEGKWYGVVGFEQDRVEMGLEIKRNHRNELKVYLYQPVINFYGLELPGVLTKQGEKYALEEMGFLFERRGEKIEGVFNPHKAPGALHRTDKLPAEVPLPNIAAGPEPRWRVKLGAGEIYATVAVSDGVIYVGTTGGVFHAVDAKDGKVVWTFNAGRPIFGEALAADKSVYFVCDNGFLYKLDSRTGRVVWRYDLGDAQISRILPHPSATAFDYKGPRPVLADGSLYVGSGDGSFHAINAETGARLWRFEPEQQIGKEDQLASDFAQPHDKIRASATLVGPLVVFGSLDQHLYALEKLTGRLVWKKNTYGPVTSSPTVIGGSLILGNRNGLLAALDPQSGTTRWRLLFWGSAVESDPVPYENLFYIGSSDLRRVSLIDPHDGRVVWRTDVFGWAWGNPAVTNKLLYVGVAGVKPYPIRHLGSLTAIDRRTGKIVWRWPMPEWPGAFLNGFVSSPVIDGEALYIGGLDGTLYCFPLAGQPGGGLPSNAK